MVKKSLIKTFNETFKSNINVFERFHNYKHEFRTFYKTTLTRSSNRTFNYTGFGRRWLYLMNNGENINRFILFRNYKFQGYSGARGLGCTFGRRGFKIKNKSVNNGVKINTNTNTESRSKGQSSSNYNTNIQSKSSTEVKDEEYEIDPITLHKRTIKKIEKQPEEYEIDPITLRKRPILKSDDSVNSKSKTGLEQKDKIEKDVTHAKSKKSETVPFEDLKVSKSESKPNHVDTKPKSVIDDTESRSNDKKDVTKLVDKSNQSNLRPDSISTPKSEQIINKEPIIDPKSTNRDRHMDSKPQQASINNQQIEINADKKKFLDPKDLPLINSSSNNKNSDKFLQIDKLLSFMNDNSSNSNPYNLKNDNVNQLFKPSTKDRINEKGERIIKEDFDIETLISGLNSERNGNSNPMSIDRKYTRKTLKRKTKEPLSEIETIVRSKSKSSTIADDDNSEIKEDNRNEMFRQKNAYEWSKQQISPNPRTIERNNFFTPVHAYDYELSYHHNTSLFPKFSNINSNSKSNSNSNIKENNSKEYLITNDKGKISKSLHFPMSDKYKKEDVFTILSRLSNPEKYINIITKLEKKNWKLIGGGGPQQLLVYERNINFKWVKIGKFIRNFFATIGVLSSIFIGMMIYVETSEIKNDEVDSLNKRFKKVNNI